MFEAGMFELGSRGEVLWVMVERGVWRQHVMFIKQ